MQDKELTPLLAECLQEVLESMCFTMTDGEADTPEEPAIPRIEVDLQFRGFREGQFWMSFPVQTALEVTSSFAGTTDLDDHQVCEIMSELGNMMCGTTLSRIADNELFELESPTARWITDSTSSPLSNESRNRVNFFIGGEIVSAAIHVGVAA